MRFTKKSADKLNSWVINSGLACIVAEETKSNQFDSCLFIKSFGCIEETKSYFGRLKLLNHNNLSSTIFSDFEKLNRSF